MNTPEPPLNQPFPDPRLPLSSWEPLSSRPLLWASRSWPPQKVQHRPSGAIKVVAAENFWGSIAAQLAATALASPASSIILIPTRTIMSPPQPIACPRRRAVQIINGIGYDPWAISSSPPRKAPPPSQNWRFSRIAPAATLTAGILRQH